MARSIHPVRSREAGYQRLAEHRAKVLAAVKADEVDFARYLELVRVIDGVKAQRAEARQKAAAVRDRAVDAAFADYDRDAARPVPGPVAVEAGPRAVLTAAIDGAGAAFCSAVLAAEEEAEVGVAAAVGEQGAVLKRIHVRGMAFGEIGKLVNLSARQVSSLVALARDDDGAAADGPGRSDAPAAAAAAVGPVIAELPVQGEVLGGGAVSG
ncbi:hypothetical protein ACFXG4_30480 [Nocardia sp. NPDC059246]|uniref:hypothetical protein n=1 Tax=unclassified Nocardia TaxID=2637762 RepID=UPI00369EF2EB